MFEQTDAALLDDLRDRENHNAWRRFVQRYQPLIYGCCRGSGMGPADAEDMTCEVLEKLQRALPQFNYAAGAKPGRFRAWLRRITQNAVCDYRRRPKPLGLAGVGGTSNLEQVYQVPARSSNPDRLAEDIEQVLDPDKLERVMLLREAKRRVLARPQPQTLGCFLGHPGRPLQPRGRRPTRHVRGGGAGGCQGDAGHAQGRGGKAAGIASG